MCILLAFLNITCLLRKDHCNSGTSKCGSELGWQMLEKEDAKYEIWILHLKLCRSDEETQNLIQTALVTENGARSLLRYFELSPYYYIEGINNK